MTRTLDPEPYPAPSSPAAVAIMKANRRVDTGPEVALRQQLHRLGLRFRKDLVVVLGEGRARPDVVFTRQRVAVFVDGCFWHACPEHGALPKANRSYWKPKLLRNVERDRDTDRRLGKAGWTVVRVWEHEDPAQVARNILRTLSQAPTRASETPWTAGAR